MAALRRAAARVLSSPARFRPVTPSRSLFTKSSSIPQSPVRTGLYATVFAISAGLFAVYYFDSRSAIHRYVLTPLLRYSLDPETGHKFAVQVLRSGLGPKDVVADDERLRFEVCQALRYFCSMIRETHSFGENRYPIRSVLQLVSTRMERQ